MTIDRRSVLGAIGSALAAPHLLRASTASAAAPTFAFVTPPIRLGSGQTGGQYNPTLSVFGDGSFNAAWVNDTGAGLRRAFVARYNANGSKRSGSVPLGDATGPTTGAQAFDVQPLIGPSGTTLALFSATRNGGGIANLSDVFVQKLNASTAKGDPPTQLNSKLADTQFGALGARLTNGNYIAIWQQQGGTENSFNVFGRVFNASGTPLFPDKIMTGKTTGVQVASTLTALPNGASAFAFSDYSSGGSIRRDYVQDLDSTGNRVGAPRLARQTSNDQPLGTTMVGNLKSIGTIVAYRREAVHNLTNLIWKNQANNVLRSVPIPFTINPFNTMPPYAMATLRSNLFFIVDFHDLTNNVLGFAGVVVTPQNQTVINPAILGSRKGGFFRHGPPAWQRSNDFIMCWHAGADASLTNLRSYFRIVRLLNEPQ